MEDQYDNGKLKKFLISLKLKEVTNNYKAREEKILENFDWYTDSVLQCLNGNIKVSKVLLSKESALFYNIFKRKENKIGVPKEYVDIYQNYELTHNILEIADEFIPELMEFAAYLLDFNFLIAIYEKGLELYPDNVEEINNIIYKLLLNNTIDPNDILTQLRNMNLTNKKLTPLIYYNLEPFDTKINCSDGSIMVNRLQLSTESQYFFNLLQSKIEVDLPLSKIYINEFQKDLFDIPLDFKLITLNIYSFIDFAFMIKNLGFLFKIIINLDLPYDKMIKIEKYIFGKK